MVDPQRDRVKARHHLRTAALGGACAAVVLASRPARADFDLEVAAGAGVTLFRTLPTLQSERVETSARTVEAQDVPLGGAVTALGGSFDIGVVVGDRWVLNGFGVGLWGAVGSYPAIVTGVDGSIARARPWTMFDVDFTLPGVGYRLKRRRWMFGAGVRTGISIMHVSASIATGADAQDMSLTGVSVMLQAELEACRRLDPVTRVCLQVAPRIYDFGIMNGGTLGLRMEWGR